MEKILDKIYFDPKSPACYSNPAYVLKEARKINPKITSKNVTDFLEKQATYTRFRKIVRNFKRLKTIPRGLNTDWQADLAVFQSISKENNGNNYLLVVVDVLSRKLYVEPIKHKSSTYMIPAFDKIFKRAGTYPWILYTDSGLEFCSKAMRDYFKSKEIAKFEAVTHPVLHATLCERMIRTIKDRLYRYFNEKNTVKWVNVIQKIADAINNSVNSTLGVSPLSINYENANEIYDRVFKESEKNKKPKFNIGDLVRIDHKKETFTKGLAKFSAELFKIIEVLAHRNPVVYRICDMAEEPIKGYFYEPELVKSHIKANWTVEKILKRRKKGNIKEFFVKWKGFPARFNRWVTEEEII